MSRRAEEDRHAAEIRRAAEESAKARKAAKMRKAEEHTENDKISDGEQVGGSWGAYDDFITQNKDMLEENLKALPASGSDLQIPKTKAGVIFGKWDAARHDTSQGSYDDILGVHCAGERLPDEDSLRRERECSASVKSLGDSSTESRQEVGLEGTVSQMTKDSLTGGRAKSSLDVLSSAFAGQNMTAQRPKKSTRHEREHGSFAELTLAHKRSENLGGVAASPENLTKDRDDEADAILVGSQSRGGSARAHADRSLGNIIDSTLFSLFLHSPLVNSNDRTSAESCDSTPIGVRSEFSLCVKGVLCLRTRSGWIWSELSCFACAYLVLLGGFLEGLSRFIRHS